MWALEFQTTVSVVRRFRCEMACVSNTRSLKVFGDVKRGTIGRGRGFAVRAGDADTGPKT